MTRQPYDEQSRHRDLASLGLGPGADEADIKRAYRALVKSRHPDRFQPQDPERARAENDLKRVNAAYTRLKRHPGESAAHSSANARPRRSAASHGEAAHSRTPRTGAYAAYAPRPDRVYEQPEEDESAPGSGRVRRQYVRAGLLIASLGLCAWLNFASPFDAKPGVPDSPPGLGSAVPSRTETPIDRYPEPAPSEPSENWHPLAREGMFAAGSSQSEVLAIQGRPEAVMGDEWYYGSSMVLFDAGRVSGYAIKDKPLRIGFDTREVTAAVFGVGSSKDEVLAIQGAPTFMEQSSWGYGMSRVEFDSEDRVTTFKVFDEPLKTRE